MPAESGARKRPSGSPVATDRTFEITLSDPGAQEYMFTLG
jgi:hypothetical protein